MKHKKIQISEDELDTLARKEYAGDNPAAEGTRIVWKEGYRAAEIKHGNDVWKLRKVIKGYIHALSTMYGELK